MHPSQSQFSLPTSPRFMKITPEIAKDWLEHRHPRNAAALPSVVRQRKYSPHIAAKYARIMKAGRWMGDSHQGIAFERGGYNIDGQHRLSAVTLCGLTVEMFVVPNCNPATFAILDSGYKRQASHLYDGPHATTVMAAARILAVVTGHVPRSSNVQGGVYDGSLESDVILEVAEAWPELSFYAAEVQNCYKTTKINSPMHLAVVSQACRTRYRDRIESWLDGLTHGVGLAGDDPRIHLRNRYVRDGRALATARGQSYNLISKAWNAYAVERPMRVLKTSENEGVVHVVQ